VEYTYTVTTVATSAECDSVIFRVRTDVRCPQCVGHPIIEGVGQSLAEAIDRAEMHMRACLVPDQTLRVSIEGGPTVLTQRYPGRLVGRRAPDPVPDTPDSA
jgi:hypothetical protein